jgi:hypothetical protein
MMVAVCFTRCDVILLCYDTFASTGFVGLGTWDWLAHFLYNTYLHLLPTDLLCLPTSYSCNVLAVQYLLLHRYPDKVRRLM